MTPNLRKLVLASAIAFGLAGGNAFAHAQTMDDVRQETRISTTYALSPYLRAHQLEVAVLDGKATLTGHVDDEVTKELAQEIAQGVSGITAVDNQLVVGADHEPSPQGGERSYGDLVDDISITAAIKSKLIWSRFGEGLSTDVETVNGKVTLAGTAASAETKASAGRLARNTAGVQSVDNKLEIQPDEPVDEPVAEAGPATAISDAWITTKVKSTFMYSRNVAGTDISVSTNGGIVTLAGSVHSGAERALAVELAQNVRGVRSVESTELSFAGGSP